VNGTLWSAGLTVTGGGTGVVAHAGSAGLRLLADRVGLVSALSVALAQRSFTPCHDRGRVLADVAVMIADGGEAIADIDVLRHQAPLLGAVASGSCKSRRCLRVALPLHVRYAPERVSAARS